MNPPDIYKAVQIAIDTFPAGKWQYGSKAVKAAATGFQTALIGKLRDQGLLKGPTQEDFDAATKAAADAKKKHHRMVQGLAGGLGGGGGAAVVIGGGSYGLLRHMRARARNMAAHGAPGLPHGALGGQNRHHEEPQGSSHAHIELKKMGSAAQEKAEETQRLLGTTERSHGGHMVGVRR